MRLLGQNPRFTIVLAIFCSFSMVLAARIRTRFWADSFCYCPKLFAQCLLLADFAEEVGHGFHDRKYALEIEIFTLTSGFRVQISRSGAQKIRFQRSVFNQRQQSIPHPGIDSRELNAFRAIDAPPE